MALTVFVGSIAAIGQLVSTGVRGALRARLQTQAVQRSISKMSEITAGSQPMQQATNVAFPDDATWHWSMTISPGAQPDLYMVEVTSTHGAQGNMGEVSFTLRRLVRNPQLALDAMIKEQQEAEEAAAAASAATGGTP